MDLWSLEQLLGVRRDSLRGENGAVLPSKKQRYVDERLDRLGTTRLMGASRDGALECADLLLRCGADVNARDINGWRAIDYSLEGGHPGVILLLLERDALPPSLEGEEKWKGMIEGDSNLKRFFRERDEFHELLFNDASSFREKIREILKSSKPPRYLINSAANSVLFAAAKRFKYDVWARLKASRFDYVTKKEKKDMESYESNEAFRKALAKDVVRIEGIHVQKMIAKMRQCEDEGAEEEERGRKVESYFRDIDGEEYGSILLKCLQDNHSLSIILDFSSTAIQSSYSGDNRCHVHGLVNFKESTMHVAALETEEFQYSDIVSNLVHELAHETMYVVFNNEGLPYSKEDIQAKEEYERIVNRVLSPENIKTCDRIIQRAADKAGLRFHELIVRVPEMVSKYKNRGSGGDGAEVGLGLLRTQAPDLLDFYQRVVQKIQKYIERNRMSGCVFKFDLLRHPEFSTAYFDKRVQVTRSIAMPQYSRHNMMRMLMVSNLKLGVSHLRMKVEGVTFVDYSRYMLVREVFNAAVARNDIRTLAIVWDNVDKSPNICEVEGVCVNMKCIARELEGAARNACVLIVPKKFSRSQKEKTNDYAWDDLCSHSKEWVLERKLNFCGVKTKLRDIVGSISDAVEVESVVGDLLDENDLSVLIERESIEIGGPLLPSLKESGKNFMRNLPECFISRDIKSRDFEFNSDVFHRRMNDLFIIENAERNDLVAHEFIGVQTWDGDSIPEDVRCFTLDEELTQSGRDDIIQGICKKIEDERCQGLKGRHFLHFFRLESKEFTHTHSFNLRVASESSRSHSRIVGCLLNIKTFVGRTNHKEALIIADAPGSGKTVSVTKAACELRETSPKCWIALVELCRCEDHIKTWEETDFDSKEKVVSHLYEVIKGGNTSIERKLFNHFIQEEKKFIIFFDAFDEICPTYSENCQQLFGFSTRSMQLGLPRPNDDDSSYSKKFLLFLKALVESTKIKVCVTTRVEEVARLEASLSTIAYSFVPLSEEKQISFLNSEWNASLKSIPQAERAKKVGDITSGLEAGRNSINERASTELVNNLEAILGKDSRSWQGVDFRYLAKEFVQIGKSTVKDEVDLLGNPLYAWMLATLVFNGNFTLGGSLTVLRLYEQFVYMRLELHHRTKIQMVDCLASRAYMAFTTLPTINSLLKFSAFFFLKEKRYELADVEMQNILKIGLVVKRGISTTFAHRTFGEFFFAVWLLQRVNEGRNTDLCLKVCLGREFVGVRQFLDKLLISNYDVESGDDKGSEREIQRPSELTESDFESVQQCLYLCIIECHEGILQYLTEISSAMFLARVIFDEEKWEISNLDTNTSRYLRNTHWTAFTLLGENISKTLLIKTSACNRSKVDYLKFLLKMLRLMKTNGLEGRLNELIERNGMRWMGVNSYFLWKDSGGKKELDNLFDFLAENVSRAVLKTWITADDCKMILVNAARCAFDVFCKFVEQIVGVGDDLAKFCLEGNNFLHAWLGVVRNCGLGDVKQMWEYVERILGDPEDRKEFLGMKNNLGWNVMSTACLNRKNPDVLDFVWSKFKLGTEDVLFDSFRMKKIFVNKECLISERFLVLLEEFWSSRATSKDSVIRLLRTSDENGNCIFLNFNRQWSASALYKFQDILRKHLHPNDIPILLDREYCKQLAYLCFKSPRWLTVGHKFKDLIEEEFKGMLQSLELSPLLDDVVLDGKEHRINVLSYQWSNGETALQIQKLQAFLVFLKRQIVLEGKGPLASHLEKHWGEIYHSLPLLEMFDGRKSRAASVSYFLAVLSESLTKGELAVVLSESYSDWKARVETSDPLAFSKLNAVDRWTGSVNSTQ